MFLRKLKNARAVKQKVWNEAENGERDSRLTLSHFARVRLLRHALPIALLIFRKKTDCFAVYVFPERFDTGGDCILKVTQQCRWLYFEFRPLVAQRAQKLPASISSTSSYKVWSAPWIWINSFSGMSISHMHIARTCLLTWLFAYSSYFISQILNIIYWQPLWQSNNLYSISRFTRLP